MGSSVEVVEAILDKGVDIDDVSRDESTALMGAADVGRWDNVKLLLQRGADATRLDSKDFKHNALHFAARHGAPDDIIIALIDAGADPHGKNYEGKTPADLAYIAAYGTTALAIEHYMNHGTKPIKSANFMA
jgi:ankyrin repeat protein